MTRSAFLSNLVSLLTAVARCDGAIRREEVKAIRSFIEQNFNLSAADQTLFQRTLKEALTADVDVAAACTWYVRNSVAADRLLFLQALYEVALGDGELSSEEQKLINRICVGLGIEEGDHRSIRAFFFEEPSVEHDYEILGLAPGAGDGDLKRAFRALAAKHHPDKVTHLGPDAVALAGKRFSEIKLAYERLKQARAV